MGWFRQLGREKPWAQGCLIFASGVALAVSGCFGALLALDRPQGALVTAIGYGLGALFCLGVLALPVGFVWWIVGLVRAASRTAPAPPPPDAGPPPGAEV